jgi:hypothetical protein
MIPLIACSIFALCPSAVLLCMSQRTLTICAEDRCREQNFQDTRYRALVHDESHDSGILHGKSFPCSKAPRSRTHFKRNTLVMKSPSKPELALKDRAGPIETQR